jgi:hypothetical protein
MLAGADGVGAGGTIGAGDIGFGAPVVSEPAAAGDDSIDGVGRTGEGRLAGDCSGCSATIATFQVNGRRSGSSWMPCRTKSTPSAMLPCNRKDMSQPVA